ncbi:hypothetical protein O0R52_22340 (plasmid) [Bacillus halotolerans]|uniref:Zinc ribbon domain-containing protein n=1 Tax=Bacillus halotolerans TaxID=260554 RepID=A0ABY7I6H0_9BACI|nr:hypothetical protein [Bacillus halotolerans]WAT23524.1 hypothetical protein O0R52_22340 [Bacillus halotolerans]
MTHIARIDTLCSVCSENMDGVFYSPIAFISLPYCHECYGSREPYWLLTAYFATLADTIADLRPETSRLPVGAQRLISNSLEVAGKTREQFYEDVMNKVKSFYDQHD